MANELGWGGVKEAWYIAHLDPPQRAAYLAKRDLDVLAERLRTAVEAGDPDAVARVADARARYEAIAADFPRSSGGE